MIDNILFSVIYVFTFLSKRILNFNSQVIQKMFKSQNLLMIHMIITHILYASYEPFGLTHTLRGHARSPVSLQFHPKNRFILASGCLSGQVFLWNLQSMTGTKMHQLCPFSHQPTTHEVLKRERKRKMK